MPRGERFCECQTLRMWRVLAGGVPHVLDDRSRARRSISLVRAFHSASPSGTSGSSHPGWGRACVRIRGRTSRPDRHRTSVEPGPRKKRHTGTAGSRPVDPVGRHGAAPDPDPTRSIAECLSTAEAWFRSPRLGCLASCRRDRSAARPPASCCSRTSPASWRPPTPRCTRWSATGNCQAERAGAVRNA